MTMKIFYNIYYCARCEVFQYILILYATLHQQRCWNSNESNDSNKKLEADNSYLMSEKLGSIVSCIGKMSENDVWII